MASRIVVEDLHAIFFTNFGTAAGICGGMQWFMTDGRKLRSLFLCDALDLLGLMFQLIRIILKVKNHSSSPSSTTTAALNMALDICGARQNEPQHCKKACRLLLQCNQWRPSTSTCHCRTLPDAAGAGNLSWNFFQ